MIFWLPVVPFTFTSTQNIEILQRVPFNTYFEVAIKNFLGKLKIAEYGRMKGAQNSKSKKNHYFSSSSLLFDILRFCITRVTENRGFFLYY